jgi:anti-sigma factor RsiW
MALHAVAARYRAVIEAAADRPAGVAGPPPPLRLAPNRRLIADALAGRSGRCRLRLDLGDPDRLAELSLAPGGLAGALLPSGAELRAARLEEGALLLDLQLPG